MLATQPTSAQALAAFLFYACATLTVLSAWAIVWSQNIVRMAVYLLLTLAGVAGLYFLLDAEFLAAVQLIVYAGGTLILIVFGVMLTARNPRAGMTISWGERLLALAMAVLIAAVLLVSTFFTPVIVQSTSRSLGDELVLSPGSPGYSSVQAIGYSLLSTYLVPFEVAAVLLLVVMIAAAFLARRRER